MSFYSVRVINNKGSLDKMGKKLSSEAQEIVDTIKNYIQEKGGDHSAWSGGIYADAPEMISLLHGNRYKHWMYCITPSLHIAQEALDYCVNTWGIDRNPAALPQVAASFVVLVYKKAGRATT